MNKNLPIVIAIVLLAIGLLRPSFINNFFNANPVSVVDTNNSFPTPTSDALKDKANDVIKALSTSPDRKNDGKKLANLYKDLATLIELEGDDEVIKDTESIRQANRIAGLMLKLDIKGKYSNLASACKALIVEAVGDDNLVLTKDLRAKAVEGFNALAWACYEGSK